jgi:hypothetical protein
VHGGPQVATREALDEAHPGLQRPGSSAHSDQTKSNSPRFGRRRRRVSCVR